MEGFYCDSASLLLLGSGLKSLCLGGLLWLSLVFAMVEDTFCLQMSLMGLSSDTEGGLEVWIPHYWWFSDKASQCLTPRNR